VGLSLAYYNYGVWSLVWSSLTQSFISTCQYWYISKWIPLKKFNRDAIKKHWQFGYKLLISGLLDSLFTNAYTVTIGKYLNPAQVGYFQRADTLKQFPVNNISAIISKVSFPLLSSIQNDDQKLKYIYKQILETIIFFVAPLLIILGVLAEPLINFLFTDRWSNSIPFFQILCFSGILYPIQVYNLDLLNVKGRSDLFLKLEIVKTISIAIIIYISLKWGITGLLYSTIVSSIFSLYVNSYFTSKLINYNFFNQISDLFPTFMISIFAGFIVLNFDKIPLIHDYNDSIRLLAGLIIGIITYISLAFIFKLNALLHIKNIFLK
jgi:O-antigen/teichoic acid export membrane protein